MTQPNERIGQYIIQEQIGKGGMATVYKAYHERLERTVAIKFMHAAFLQDASFLQRFEREARIVAKLEHPRIIPIYDFDDSGGTPYLVMKYIEGQTLKQRAIKTGLTLHETAQTMSQVATALDYAHTLGILHRDLKPSNIMIDTENRPYLMDFGLARMVQVGESTISHDMMLGTPFYISPEQAQGVKELTHATDIYSFAVIVYELITGTVPFQAESAYGIVHGHIAKTPTPPSELNPKLNKGVDEVMAKVLAKDPKDRYPTASAFMQAFQEALDGVQAVSGDSVVAKNTTQPTSTPIVSIGTDDEKVGRKYKVESEIDFKNINWRDVGERIKSGVYLIAEEIEERMDSQISKRRGRKANDPAEIIRRRIAKKHKERQEFITHLGIFILINIMLWVAFRGQWWLIFPTLGWGAGLFGHWMEYNGKYGAGADKVEAEVQKELSQIYGITPKMKNDAALRLEDLDGDTLGVRMTEEGELTDSFVEEAQGRRGRRRK